MVFLADEIDDTRDCTLSFYDDGTYTSSMDSYGGFSYWKIENDEFYWKRSLDNEWMNYRGAVGKHQMVSQKILKTIKDELEFNKYVLGEDCESR